MPGVRLATVFGPGPRGSRPWATRTAAVLLTCSAAFAGIEVDLPRAPSIAPDGTQVVFSWRGDLWRVPIAGGDAIRLTSHPAVEGASAWSPDGSLIAFESERDGFRNIHLMKPDGSGLRQLTYSDLSFSLTDFGHDPEGNPAVFVSAALEGDLYRSPRPYRVPIDGGAPIRVHDAFGDEASPSPDGSVVTFTRGGSSWTRRHYRGSDQREVWSFTPATGGFRRLTDWAGNDGQARWMGDDAIVFMSDREGDTVNLHMLRLDDDEDGASPTALTRFAGRDIHGFDVSRDGTTAIIANWDGLHRLDLSHPHAAPEPIEIVAPADLADQVVSVELAREASEAALSPDGKTMAMIAFGDVWVRPIEDGRPPRRVTSTVAREQDLAWSPDGLRLYFTSDREGSDGIDMARVRTTRAEIRDGYRDRTTAAVEKPTPDPSASEDPAPDAGGTTAPAAEGAEEPSDKKDDETDVKDAKRPKDPALDPSRWQDSVTFVVEPVVAGPTEDRRAVPSPDGRSLAFRRGRGDLCILDLASGEVRNLVSGWDASLEAVWSPDSQWLAVAMSDRDFNRDIHLIPADGSDPGVNITRHPDTDAQPRFSADGKILAFVSDRTGDESDVWMVFLDRELERMPQRDLEAYFEETSTAVKKRKPIEPFVPQSEPSAPAEGTPESNASPSSEVPPASSVVATASKAADPAFTREDLTDAWRRLRRVTTIDGGESGLGLLPAGDRLVFSASGGPGEGRGLYAIDWDGTDLKKLGSAADLQGISLDGATLSLVSGGQARTMPAAGGSMKSIELPERIEIDRREWNLALFDEAARILGEGFYLDPSEKGLDWRTLASDYRELAEASRTPDELEWVVNRLFGELNASHLGMRANDPTAPPRRSQGRLGTILRPVDGGFEVVEILEGSPAQNSLTPLVAGDVIVGVEFDPLVAGDTVERRLRDRVGRETVISVRRQREDGETIDLDCLIVPVSSGGLRDLVYRETQRRAAERVDEWSGGRLGYTHVRSMDTRSLEEFEGDLHAAAEGREGLLIDVRNNGGGFTADRLLASIMVQPHAYTVPRGADPGVTNGYPRDRLFIQRYILPINMLCNEKSFSNAEIVSHAFKTLDRGTLVGMPTYGGVISTGSHSLVDGSTIRMPFRGWYLLDGTDMENHGAVPDLIVEQTPEDESAGLDAQLKAAVEDLQSRLAVPEGTTSP
jgi:tricorn protease